MKKIIMIPVMLFGLTALIAACGKSGGGKLPSKDAGDTGGGEKKILSFWFPPFADSNGAVTDEQFWKGQMEDFEKENHCEVKIEITPWDGYEEKYLSGTNSNQGPDVGYMYMEMFHDYIDMKAIIDIDSYFTEEEKNNFIYYRLGNIGGGQYGLPVVVGNPRILVANMDILKQAGMEKVPETFEELVRTCKAIKEKVPNVIPFIQDWGANHYGSLNNIYWPFFWGEGAEIVDKDGNLTIDTPEGVKATRFLHELKKQGCLPETVTSVDDAMAVFKNKEAAMVMTSSSGALKLEGINWEFTEVLKGSKDAKTFVAADALVMFDKCKDKELAAKLMKYVTSPKVMNAFHKEISEQPPITKDDDYVGDERYKDLFVDGDRKFKTLPVFKGASSMYDTLFKNLQAMMQDEMTPEEVLKETTEYYNQNLK